MVQTVGKVEQHWLGLSDQDTNGMRVWVDRNPLTLRYVGTSQEPSDHSKTTLGTPPECSRTIQMLLESIRPPWDHPKSTQGQPDLP